MRICILGATGLVGRELLHLLPRAWPGCELDLYASRDQALEVEGRHYAVRGANALDAVDATGGQLAFVALDDEHSARYVPRLRALATGHACQWRAGWRSARRIGPGRGSAQCAARRRPVR